MIDRLAAQTLVDGRYEVLSRLGSGGMADVYCAHDSQLDRKVALKVLYRRFAADDEFVERFRREASSAAGLQHPNVVSVYDRGEWEGTYYIAMEYLQGRSLKQVVQEEGPLDPARAIDFTVQILKAARFAHRHGVIHRDLKPHNVIVADEGRAKVTDFGIARAGKSEMTQTGSIMGTAQYLSPEQAQGHAVSPQSDLYSVGVILYEMVTGRVPFDAESAVTIALKHVAERPVSPSAFNAAVTPDLEAAVMRALEKDPARRFADADEFIATLQAARDGIPEGAVALPRPAQATEEVTALALPPTPVSPVPWAPQEYAPPAPPPPVGERARGGGWWKALLVVLVLAGLAVAGVFVFVAEKVAVPNVVGGTQAAAELRLKKEGFKTEAIRETNSKPRGTVVGQDPSPGSRVRKGSTIQLTVSDGPGQAIVPHVDGLGRNAARALLREAGFRVEESRQADADVGTNRVIRTFPSNGEVVDKGTTVQMVVSTGAERATVPGVVGQTLEDARATLEDAGFKVRAQERESDAQPGTVVDQDPKGAQTARQGSRVTVFVAKAPDTIAVPDVTGKSEDEAITILAAANLIPKRREQAVDDPAQDGRVLDQSPKKDKRVKRGSEVAITIGRFTEGPPPPEPPPAPAPPPGGAVAPPPPDPGATPQ
jgi:eukaryotic-like serine/threonine-protein kinase